jgi:hypothetical protein
VGKPAGLLQSTVASGEGFRRETEQDIPVSMFSQQRKRFGEIANIGEDICRKKKVIPFPGGFKKIHDVSGM